MTLREAEKAVLAAARAWRAVEFGDPREAPLAIELNAAVAQYEAILAAGKPRVRCFCGKEVSVEGDHLRYHIPPGADSMHGHAPMLTDSRLPTAQPRGGGNEEGT